MRKLLSLMVAGLFTLTLGACDGQPTQLSEPTQVAPETEVNANHGSSDEESVTATAVLRAVGTFAAQEHGFQRGEVVGAIHVTDDGEVTSVEGEASGLIPEHPYGSLFYDKRSSAQGSPASGNAALNAGACEPGVEPTGHPLHISDGQMAIVNESGLVGAWDVERNGDATLEGETAEYVPLKKIGTVSIRDFALASEVESGDEFVVACGVVTHDPAN